MLDHRKLRKYRRLAEMTMVELAEKAGYSSANSIWKIENLVVDVPLSRLEKIAMVFGIPVQDLLMEEPCVKTSGKADTNEQNMEELQHE